MSERKILIVSNRLPVTIQKMADGTLKSVHSSGGLVSGLEQFHQTQLCIWIGHSGTFLNEPGFDDLCRDLENHNLISVPLRKKTYTGYYNGMSNDVIWPLFHYFPAAMKHKREDWQSYIKVNEIFAEKVLSIAKDEDFI